jgi:hypothetical protein
VTIRDLCGPVANCGKCVLALALSAIMISCGGGGSGTSTAAVTPVASPPNAPPAAKLDLAKMQMLVAGGASSDYIVSPTEEDGLAQIGTRRLRLINVDGDDLVAVAADGTLQLKWSYHLDQGLALCREHKWIPHIIIGHAVPPPLAMKGADGRTHGPSSWTIYDRYIQAFLDYVVVSQGFTETEWEVGNEMSIPSENWVAPLLPASANDPAGFSAYATLYSQLASVIDDFRHQHPGTVLRVGGPAADPVWAINFVDLVAGKNIPADFVSLHAYGNQYTGTGFRSALSNIQQEMAKQQISLPIAITEWGPNTGSEVNFKPIAGAFALEFASTLSQAGISDAIFLAVSQFPTNDWPVLYTTDQTPTDIMVAFEALATLNGTQGTCTSSADLSCVATTAGDGLVSLVLWNFSWKDTYFPDVMTEANETYTVTVQPGGSPATSYSVQAAQLDSAPWDQVANPIALDSSGTNIQVNIRMPYGSYGKISLQPN